MTFAEIDATNKERGLQEDPVAFTRTPVIEAYKPPTLPMVTVNFSSFTDESTIALVAALAQAQGEFEPIIKNREVKIVSRRTTTAYTFMYADLDSIRRSTQPALSKHGLAVMSLPIQKADGGYLRTLITHSVGGFVWAELLIPAVGSDDDDVSETIKAFGGLLTYLRRYLLIGMLNLSADHDLDENGTEASGRKTPDDANSTAMRAAKTIQELSRVMSSIPEKEKRNYLDLFNTLSVKVRESK